jgi:hypothetical protein
MSIPSVPLRYAGIWNSTTLYFIDYLVVSPVDDKAYVLVVPSLSGGTDPSVPSADWVLVPDTGGGGGAGVSSLETLTGEITLSSSTATFTPSGQNIDVVITYPVPPPSLPSGRYLEATGGSKVVVLSITGLTENGIVSICYVHTGGGGGSQYTVSIVPSADECTINFNTFVDLDDQIIWQVLSL